MSKLARSVILILVTAVGVGLLMPTIKWYGFIPAADKELLKMPQDVLERQTVDVKKKVVQLKKVRKSSLSLGLDLKGGMSLMLQVNDADLRKQLLEKYDFDEKKAADDYEKELATASERALQVLKNRIDQFGVAEVSVQKTFDGRLSVEIPGMDNPNLAKDVLSRVGKLEFHIVDEATMEKLADVIRGIGYVPTGVEMPEGYELPIYGTNGEIIQEQGKLIPETSEWVPYYTNDAYDFPYMAGWYLLKREVGLEGQMIKDARPDDQNGRPQVAFTLTDEGTDIFGDLTGNNIGKRLAIVMDGKVKSAPNIQGAIDGGSGVITGNFTQEEIAFLVNVLKSGSLPVKLDIVQERIIGPSLGQDTIEQSIRAALIGLTFVVLFMIIYYKFSGFIAIIGLIFNMFYLLAALAGYGSTITLSGIAGMALTAGMAVDANVIIFERVREEVRRSRGNFRHSLTSGFEQAQATIWDSNLTTLIAAFAIYGAGSGSIRGFGLTLAIGVIANIFAALFICRLVFDLWMDLFHKDRVSI